MVVSMVCASTYTSFGLTTTQLYNAPDSNASDRLLEIAELKEHLDSYESIMVQDSGRKTLSVDLVQQSNNYYCGPACVQMNLKYFGITKAQSALGSEMGTNRRDGTYVYKVKDCLNKYLGNGKYKYVYTSEIRFPRGLKSSIDKGYPVVCHLMTGELPLYKGIKDTGHYVLATGYYYGYQASISETTVYYNDPINDSRFYGKQQCTWNEMTKAIDANASLYIMAS
jgi:hypothetical protein